MAKVAAIEPHSGYVKIARRGEEFFAKVVEVNGAEQIWVQIRGPDGAEYAREKYYASDTKGNMYFNKDKMREEHLEQGKTTRAYKDFGGTPVELHHESEIHWDPVKKDFFVWGRFVPKTTHDAAKGHHGGADTLLALNTHIITTGGVGAAEKGPHDIRSFTAARKT